MLSAVLLRYLLLGFHPPATIECQALQYLNTTGLGHLAILAILAIFTNFTILNLSTYYVAIAGKDQRPSFLPSFDYRLKRRVKRVVMI